VECVLRRMGRVVTVGANSARWMCPEVDAAATFAISLGGEDPVIRADQDTESGAGLPLFAPSWLDEAGRDLARTWLRSQWTLLEKLGLEAYIDRLVVSKNRLLVVARPSGAEQLIGRIDAVVSLAASRPSAATESKKLPAGFEELQDLVTASAIGDDERRTSKIASASDVELQSLRARVFRLIRQINEILDSERGGTSLELANLGLPAEVATEADIELGARST
jgi:hypothetical protein